MKSLKIYYVVYYALIIQLYVINSIFLKYFIYSRVQQPLVGTENPVPSLIMVGLFFVTLNYLVHFANIMHHMVIYWDLENHLFNSYETIETKF